MSNNPIRFTDPTGHMQESDPYKNTDPKAKCKPGDTSCNWLGKSKKPPKPAETEEVTERLQISQNITYGYTLGGNGGPMPDYYSEGEYSANVPHIQGASPGRGLVGPNPCGTAVGPAAGFCFVSLLSSIVPPANQPGDPSHNFFLSFNVTYEEGIGVTVSNIQYSNQYGGDAVFESLYVNNTRVQKGTSLMPTNGSFHPVDNSGSFTSDRTITIDGKVQTIIDTPNGPGAWPFLINIQIPAGFLNP